MYQYTIQFLEEMSEAYTMIVTKIFLHYFLIKNNIHDKNILEQDLCLLLPDISGLDKAQAQLKWVLTQQLLCIK